MNILPDVNPVTSHFKENTESRKANIIGDWKIPQSFLLNWHNNILDIGI